MQTFGHDDHKADIKRREAKFERWRDEILRQAIDRTTMARVKSRALGDPEVRRDSTLAKMIQGFLSQREAEMARLKAQAKQDRALWRRPQPEDQEEERGGSAQADRADHPHDPSTEEAEKILQRLNRQFRDYQSHLYEAEARSVVENIRALLERFPVLGADGKLDHYAASLEDLGRRRRTYQAQIEELGRRAVRAAEHGKHGLTATALRRLSSIHAAHPQLLPDGELSRIRNRITEASEHHEHRMAAKALVRTERAVAEELKHISGIIHHFHKVARRVPHDAEAYHHAQEEYHQAIKEVRSHDKEWLAGVVLELVDLLAEWHEAPHGAEVQVDHFIESVRSSLSHMRGEIREIERETHDGK